MRTDDLISRLAADAPPVAPLASPMRRALVTLGAIGAAGLLAIALSDMRAFLSRYAAREMLMGLEMAAVLATGLLAVTAAFFASVPGRSWLWIVSPLPFLCAWLLLSGAGCTDALANGGAHDGHIGESWRCLRFIMATSFLLAVPLSWALSRAKPVNPMRVALLAGLGIAALSTFLLNFFHPFDVTALDLGIHVGAILIVVAAMSAFNRYALRPA